MQLRKLTLALLITSLLLFGSSSSVSAEGMKVRQNNGIVTLETDTLVVEVRGGANIPSFFFWLNGNDTDTYKLQMDQVFEINDTNNNSIYDLGNDTRVTNSMVSLAQYDWDFSDFDVVTNEENVTESIHFNVTSALPEKGNGTVDEFSVSFNNHIYADSDASVKFDIVLSNYEFKDENAMLVVAFKLMIPEGKEVRHQFGNDTVEFGNAYFNSEDFAECDNGTKDVGLSYGLEEGSQKIYIAYEHFTGDLYHDPTIGLNLDSIEISDPITSPNDSDTSATDENSDLETPGPNFLVKFPELSLGALVSVTLASTVIFLAVPVLLLRRKQ